MTQEAFNDWWGSDYDDSTNPCMTDSFEYWAWEGWHAALALTSTKCEVQPAQEPIGYAVPTFDFDNSVIKKVHYAGTVPLYTAPPQRTWVGLEGEEIRYLWEEATKPDRSTMTMVTSFAQAIEAALRSKNT